MTMILVFTGKNLDEALAPTNAVTEYWRYYRPRHPQIVGFERALKADAAKNNIVLPGKLYLAKVDHEEIADPLSAKFMIPEIVAAVDAVVLEDAGRDDGVKKRLSALQKAHDEEWANYADPDGRIRSDNETANRLNRERKEAEEVVWYEAYGDYFSQHDIWGYQ